MNFYVSKGNKNLMLPMSDIFIASCFLAIYPSPAMSLLDDYPREYLNDD